MAIKFRPEDLKYLNNTSSDNIETSSGIKFRPEDLPYLNNTNQEVKKEIPKVNIKDMPASSLNFGTPSTQMSKTLPSKALQKSLIPETIRSATTEESQVQKESPTTFQEAIDNYNRNTRNTMTGGQKVKEDINKVALEASENIIRPLIGYTTGAPEKLIRTGIYGTQRATGAISKEEYEQKIVDEETGKTKTLSGLIAGDPKVGAAIKLGEQEAYRKIAGAGVETGLNFILPKLLTGTGGAIAKTLESGIVGAGYGVAQQAQEQNPDYLKGAGYGFVGGAILSGGISALGKGIGRISNKIDKDSLYKSLANTSNKEEIFNNLKERFTDVPESILNVMSDDLLKLNNKKDVENYFKIIENLKNTPPVYFDENGFRPKQETPIKESLPKHKVSQEIPKVDGPQIVLPKPLKNNINSQNVSYTKTIPLKVKTNKSVVNTKVDNSVSPENSLISEAKKYKSAEEFVKAQPTAYRGEGGSNVAQGKALLAEGKHFASDAEYPKGFGKVGEYVLKPNAKVLDLGDSTFAEISQKLGIPERIYISPKELSTIAKEKGYDVVKYTGEYKSTGKQFSHTVDLTGDSYITKSQLTDIWNKAQKENIPVKKTNIKPEIKTEIKTKPQVKTEVKTNTDETFKSRVFERLQKENPDLLQGDLNSTKINLEKESQKAVKLLKEDKQKLYDIAMGKESSPDLTSTMANITLAERAIEEGNNELASKLIKNRSLAQTRRGQEIVSEKASLTDNSSSRYVKQLLSDRLDEVGKKYTDNIKDITQKSSKQKAITKIEKDVADLESRIKNKKIKTPEALALLDKLTCLA